jgi:hypothetical protein
MVAVGICVIGASALHWTNAQGVTDPSPCPALSGDASNMLESYRFADTTTDSGMQTWRLSIGLSVVPVSQIVAVSDTTVCRRALTAYNTLLVEDSLPASVAVDVVKYGTTRYIIADPAHLVGEWAHELVVDTAFTKIAVAAR